MKSIKKIKLIKYSMKSIKKKNKINKKSIKMKGGAAMLASRRRSRSSVHSPNRYNDLRSRNTDVCWKYCLPLACYIPAYHFSQNPDCPAYVPACTALAASGWLYNSCLR